MEINRIYNENCLETMKRMPDNYCDIFTDPPYNVGKNYGIYNDNLPDAEYKNWIKKVLIECKRISNILTIYIPKKWNLFYWNVLGPEFQEVILSYNPEGAIRSGFVNQFNKLLTNSNPKAQKKYVKNVWHNIRERSHGFYFNEETYGNPGYTSERLTRQVISELCTSELIYDPFIGTGTTAVAALCWDKEYIGSEISQEYCTITEKRIKQHKSQFKLDLKQ